MVFAFLPSLQHILHVKIASIICRIPEVKASIVESRNKLHFSPSQEWTALINKKISLLGLPSLLQKRIDHLILPISLTMIEWLSYHLSILGFEDDLLNCLHWKSDGTIDELETATSLVRNENIRIDRRFNLACIYCLENDIRELWKKLYWYQQHYLSRNELFSLTQCYWIPYLRGMRTNRYNFYCRNTVALKYFLKREEEPRKRYRCLKQFILQSGMKPSVVRFCLFKMAPEEQEKIFKKYPAEVLMSFLEWPFQNLFLDVADHLWSYLPKGSFFSIMHFIHKKKIMNEWQDFDYEDLLFEFWRRSPTDFKNYVNENNEFLSLRNPFFSKPPFSSKALSLCE
ncbi:uncharacterized protein TNCV_2264951 [Trichonephila clavipes]|nr:uncharacterized protein TNCV_2264951 [Trichonephila clavipes]